MSITIVWVGKTRQRFLEEGIEEYLKRLQPYVKTETVTIRDVSLKNSEDLEQVKEKEAERILKYLLPTNFNIALHDRGRELDSRGFSQFIQGLEGKRISFFIGGVYGLANSFLNRCDHVLSLSKMTFTHQMARLVLTEQLYRAYTIIHNKKYHY